MSLVQHDATNVGNGAGLSGSIWGNCNRRALLDGSIPGFFVLDHFVSPSVVDAAGTPNVVSAIPYAYYIDTGNTILPSAVAGAGGVLLFTSDGTDNDVAAIQAGGGDTGTAGCMVFKTKANAGTKLWFETRVQTSSIATGAFFVGLAEEGCAADGSVLADVSNSTIASFFADKDYVGFYQGPSTAYTSIDVGYNTASGTDTVHVDGSATAYSALGTIAADTWVKLGLKYDPEIGVEFFVNGQKFGTTLQASAAGFPDGEEVAPIICIGAEGTAKTLSADFLAFAQYL